MKTEFDIQKSLFDRFATLNEFSGISFLTSTNVYYANNKTFEKPDDNRFFKIAFLSDTPESIGAFQNDLHRYNGFLQIDICVPLDKGETEAQTKYVWISKLFSEGSTFDDVEINKVYVATKGVEENYYKVVVRINFTATLDNEE